ncbi:MAG: hypothetical protein IJM39_08895 [Firmicutes bacterium]|nr:hypothetical protein [Bacillota bacterium]
MNRKLISTRYYLIYDRIVGKREIYSDRHSDNWLFKNGKWVPDTGFVIMDHLIGYDSSEPEDSPYRIGSTDVLMEMDEISEEEAMRLTEKEERNEYRQ